MLSGRGKRPARDASISPPPLKRKVQSTTTNAAVASFFTPASQKPKDRTTWSERAPRSSHDTEKEEDDVPATLLVAKYTPEGDASAAEPPTKRPKIAAFDLDSTLIRTSSGRKHSDGPGDWKWWDRSVPGKLRDLYHEDGYRLVVFTNQGGLTLHSDPKVKNAPKNIRGRVDAFKTKVSAVLAQLDLPLTLYAATAKDVFRKPRAGMWAEMLSDYGLSPTEVDLGNSLFVGDAGGRTAQLGSSAVGSSKKGATSAVPKDFSCSDRNLAHNVGISFHTPEEFFLGEEPRPWVRDFDLAHHPFREDSLKVLEKEDGVEKSNAGEEKDVVFERRNPKDMVLFCGPPGAGKSTFFSRHLKPLGYERVNQDTLKSKEKCILAAVEFLKDGVSVAIDNTNPDPDTRAQWVALAKKHGVPIRCVWFRTPLLVAQHNDAVRSMNKALNPESRPGLPQLAFNSFNTRFREPRETEGFQDVVRVEFAFRGTKEEYDVWGRYWL